MKKKFTESKGFSLIELLIVVAIMGILAVISFSALAGVLGNSKKRADYEQGRMISKALVSYMLASNDPTLDKLYYVKEGDSSYSRFKDDPNWKSNWDKLVYALQTEIANDSTDIEQTFGPYLAPIDGDTPSTSNYAPQWSPESGGEFEGYKIYVYPKDLTAKVIPVETGAGIEITP